MYGKQPTNCHTNYSLCSHRCLFTHAVSSASWLTSSSPTPTSGRMSNAENGVSTEVYTIIPQTHSAGPVMSVFRHKMSFAPTATTTPPWQDSGKSFSAKLYLESQSSNSKTQVLLVKLFTICTSNFIPQKFPRKTILFWIKKHFRAYQISHETVARISLQTLDPRVIREWTPPSNPASSKCKMPRLSQN